MYRFALLILLILSCVEKREQNVPEVLYMESPADKNSSLPYLFSNSGTTLLSWVEKPNDSLTRFRYTELIDGSWQEPRTITSGTDWFVNWADFPAIVENNGHLFSYVLKKSSVGTYSYDVKMNLKPEGAKNWKVDIPLHNDNTSTEHGFVTAVPYKIDSFFVTWLDGRNTEEKEGQHRGAMTIRSAEVSKEGTIADDSLLDPRTCDCCQTTATVTKNGPVVIYRDRSEEEVRDISIMRQVNGIWTEPKVIHNDDWKIKGCPVNGPKAAAFENSLVVAWFTAAEDKPTVKVAFSQDNGETFKAPVHIGTTDIIGRVDIAVLDQNRAVVSFMESKNGKAQLKAILVNSTGQLFTERTIAEMDSSRKSGFPQMELVDDKLLFAWTDVSGKSLSIKIAHVSVEAFDAY